MNGFVVRKKRKQFVSSVKVSNFNAMMSLDVKWSKHLQLLTRRSEVEEKFGITDTLPKATAKFIIVKWRYTKS